MSDTSPSRPQPAPVTRLFEGGAESPNNPTLPVVIHRAVLAGRTSQAVCVAMEANGWGGTWVWTVFDYHHYHPDAHEALTVASGEARLRLGGPGPEGEDVDVAAGDCLILPAGTGHCRLSQSDDFRICGAYPPGQQDFTTRRAGPDAGRDASVIAAVALPETDPIFGRDGPLPRLWAEAISRG